MNEQHEFRTGQSVLCHVEAPEVGGYLVKIHPGNIDGFLPSNEPLETGRQVPATFVCMDGERALLTFAYMIGTTERVQFSTSTDSINAFAVWADSYPSNMRQRRAIDIFMPALNENCTVNTSSREMPLDALRLKLTSENFTGCLKVQSEETLSRSAALFYEGRIVGCIHGTKSPKSVNAPYSVANSMQMMFAELKRDSAQIQFYELPAQIILSMSANFLGCPVRDLDDIHTPDAMAALVQEFSKRDETACLTLSESASATISVSFFYDGRYVGTFLVEKQQYKPGNELPLELPESFGNAKLDASFLPKAMTTSSIQYGYVIDSVLSQVKDLSA